jgi:DNA-binding response OmpR family regulator
MSLKVLIAEPDWRFARTTEEYLESHAHHVVQEADTQKALQRVGHWSPDLVILAAELAGGGLLRSLQGLPNRPAVLLTGWLDRYDMAWRAWQIGGDELLIKPVFSTEEIHQAIVTALENAATCTRNTARRSKLVSA